MTQQLKQLEAINGIFNRFIVDPIAYFSYTGIVPEGFDLVEQKDHKLKRLNAELASKKSTQAIYEKQLVSLSKEIEELEKEIVGL